MCASELNECFNLPNYQWNEIFLRIDLSTSKSYAVHVKLGEILLMSEHLMFVCSWVRRGHMMPIKCAEREYKIISFLPGESTHTLFIHSHTLYTLYTPFIWKVYRVYGKCIEWTDFIHSIHFSYTLYTFYMRVNQRWMKFRPPLIHFWS